MVKLNKHFRMRARTRLRGETYEAVAEDFGVPPFRGGKGMLLEWEGRAISAKRHAVQ